MRSSGTASLTESQNTLRTLADETGGGSRSSSERLRHRIEADRRRHQRSTTSWATTQRIHAALNVSGSWTFACSGRHHGLIAQGAYGEASCDVVTRAAALSGLLENERSGCLPNLDAVWTDSALMNSSALATMSGRADEKGRALVQRCWFELEDSALTIGRLAACLLDDERKGIAFVEETQFSLR